MQSYVAQRQVEMAIVEKHINLAPAVQPAAPASNGDTKDDDAELAKFKDLSTTQMMDFLSRDLMHWQQMISEPTDKSPKP